MEVVFGGQGARGAVADFNRDGRADSVGIGVLTGYVELWLRGTDGVLRYSSAYAGPSPGPRVLVVEDFNRDGRPDVAVAGGSRKSFVPYHNVHVLLNQIEVNRNPDCAGATVAPAELWPPNHELIPVEIGGVTDPDGDPVTVTVTGVTQDEPLERRLDRMGMIETPGPVDEESAASAASCPDGVIVGGGAELRAERLGRGNGRVYALSFVATDGRGGACTGTVRVCVPHDRGRPRACIDDGQSVNSLGPCNPGPALLPPAAVGAVALRVLPARGVTATLEYELPSESEVALAVYDVAGRRVKVVENARRPSGVYRLAWDTSGVPAGIYFYRLRTPSKSLSVPLILLR